MSSRNYFYVASLNTQLGSSPAANGILYIPSTYIYTVCFPLHGQSDLQSVVSVLFMAMKSMKTHEASLY